MSTTPDVMNGSGRQKRVMPSRSRRGGPGIGGTDVDLMILETQKRKFENEPLIPANTKFVLTTNSSLIPSSSSSSSSFKLELNNHAYERYFDRPEVRQSYKAQQLIQTPEFSALTVDASVGGRFRPRIHEDDIADTSDSAYEKRHRKYETFEKRQRLREKEKLKHEQYKLKERIEQLRAMDSNAFLTLPSASFPLVPAHEDDDLQGTQVNGASPYNEGERRRKEMLDIAMGLEERYRVLLPPDRRYLEREKKQTDSAEPDGAPVEEEEEDEVHEPNLDLAGEESGKQGDRLKLKIKFPSREQSSIPVKPTHPAVPKKTKRSALSPTTTRTPTLSRMSPSTTFPVSIQPNTAPSPFYFSNSDHPIPDVSDTTVYRKLSPQITELISISRPHKRQKGIRDADDAGIVVSAYERANGVPPLAFTTSAISVSAPNSRIKHIPRSASPKSGHTSYAGASSNAERPPCLLMVSALRTSSVPMARKTQRHITAFGVKLPEALEDIREFELPWWILPNGEGELSQDVAGGGIEHQELIDRGSSSTAAEVRTFLDGSQDSEVLAALAVP